jgi:hypothetical protein
LFPINTPLFGPISLTLICWNTIEE